MAGQVMRAVRVAQFGGPEVLKLMKDVPVPTPKENEVLIKVFTAGVNPVDTYIRAGGFSALPQLPYTPGYDAAGVVEAVGSQVTDFKKGDKVYTFETNSGAYAEYTVASHPGVYKLHKSLSFSQGAALGIPYFTAYRALKIKAQVKPGESVLVHGASGAVGIAACQMARAYGMTVYGTAGTAEGLELVKGNGAHHVFNHREEGYTDKIQSETKGKGVDVVLEMLADVNLDKDLQLVAKNGRVILIGCRGSIEINPIMTMFKESAIIGVGVLMAKPEELEESGAAVYAGMEQGWVKPVVGAEFPLEEVEKAHIQVINNPGTKGKIILSV